MKTIPLILFSVAILLSCEKKQTNTSEKNVNEVSDSVKVVDSSSTVSSVEKVDVNPATTDASNSVQTQVATTSAKPALNPAHGEPFHRCDISVGAPIDSAPQQNSAAPVSNPPMQSNNSSFNTNPISPSMAEPASSPQAIGPKPALNPAHGEPHHRCDLQVGAPLS